MRKIFLRPRFFAQKETHIRKEKEKIYIYCASTFELHSIEYKTQTIWWIDPYLLTQINMQGQTPLQQENSWESTKLKSVFVHYFHPDPFLFSFSVLAYSSFSQITRTIAKRWCLLIGAILKRTILSWSCFYLESQFHVSPYVRKYANVSEMSCKTQFVRKN